jgi:hypothetical protein
LLCQLSYAPISYHGDRRTKVDVSAESVTGRGLVTKAG